jgi:FtsZ-interacting cell division protein ZipA
MDKEVIILSGVIVLVVLLFVSANKWQKAEKKLKKAEKKLEEYKQGNSSDSFS